MSVSGALFAGRPGGGRAPAVRARAHGGRGPAAGGAGAANSGGDREMLEWAAAAPGGLALLVDHDDADREFAYRSMGVTVDEAEPITAVAERQGWTVASMAQDWSVVFGADD